MINICPEQQYMKDRVFLGNPPIPVVIEYGQSDKPVRLFRNRLLGEVTKQLFAISDLSVAISIESQKRVIRVARGPRPLPRPAVCSQIEANAICRICEFIPIIF